MKTNAIVLAAGKGTRMKSLKNDISKVSFPMIGQPLVAYVLDVTDEVIDGRKVVIVGHGGERTIEVVNGRAEIAWQREQKGTGHAIMQVAPLLKDDKNNSLILSGDVPLIRAESLKKLIAFHEENHADLTIMSAKPHSNFGYGRIVRDENGNVVKVVEQADANEEEKAIREVNAGIYLFNNELLFKHLNELNTENKQGELYLTDMIAVFINKGYKVQAYVLEDPNEMLGVNDRAQLAQAEKIMRRRINHMHMVNGVTLENPKDTYIGPHVKIGNDTFVGAGVHLLGETTIGFNNEILSGTHIKNTVIGDNNTIISSFIEDATIGNENAIGPMARLRGHNVIGNHTKIGNFVEFKAVNFGNGSKCAHLTYLGDVTVGENVNVGCGTIIANYDGVNKFKSVIGNNVFIGSGSTLISPVNIGDNAFIAAGSTINHDVEPHALAIARQRQMNKSGYADVLHERALEKKKENK